MIHTLPEVAWMTGLSLRSIQSGCRQGRIEHIARGNGTIRIRRGMTAESKSRNCSHSGRCRQPRPRSLNQSPSATWPRRSPQPGDGWPATPGARLAGGPDVPHYAMDDPRLQEEIERIAAGTAANWKVDDEMLARLSVLLNPPSPPHAPRDADPGGRPA
ncbi:hypothetical protein H4W31_001241 [Plantactinospora soyae]|uniref:Uncharacterized protein n=2 Tax=Plantactinospora soyae TaxID=1544732 RepID=A0A927M520_9ACTN|nr:hypothetical protein [Plantactinospora soyae]